MIPETCRECEHACTTPDEHLWGCYHEAVNDNDGITIAEVSPDELPPSWCPLPIEAKLEDFTREDLLAIIEEIHELTSVLWEKGRDE